MILYHGSNVDIQKIDLSKCKPRKDFGQGFYLTTIEEQAVKMAHRIVRMYGGSPLVSVFDFDDKAFEKADLKVKIFAAPTIEWAKFVIANRNYDRMDCFIEDNNSDGRYDLVIGPIANDDLALLFRQFTEGTIAVDTLINEMKYKKLTNQYSFHSERALNYLAKKAVKNV